MKPAIKNHSIIFSGPATPPLRDTQRGHTPSHEVAADLGDRPAFDIAKSIDKCDDVKPELVVRECEPFAAPAPRAAIRSTNSCLSYPLSAISTSNVERHAVDQRLGLHHVGG